MFNLANTDSEQTFYVSQFQHLAFVNSLPFISNIHPNESSKFLLHSWKILYLSYLKKKTKKPQH